MIYHKTEAIAKSFYLFFYVCQNFCFDCIHWFFFLNKPKFYDLPSSLLYLFSIKRIHYNELFSTAYLLVFFCWKKGLEWHLLVNCARYFCCYTLHMILLHKLFRTHDFLYCACHVFDTILLIEKKKAKAILVGNIVLIHNENLKWIFLYSREEVFKINP